LAWGLSWQIVAFEYSWMVLLWMSLFLLLLMMVLAMFAWSFFFDVATSMMMMMMVAAGMIVVAKFDFREWFLLDWVHWWNLPFEGWEYVTLLLQLLVEEQKHWRSSLRRRRKEESSSSLIHGFAFCSCARWMCMHSCCCLDKQQYCL